MMGDLPTLPSNVLICLEHTELLTPKIIEAMPAISLEIHDTEVPVVGIFIHKGASEPLLEMADHLTWHAQRQYRDQAPGKALMPEFRCYVPQRSLLRHLSGAAPRKDAWRRRAPMAAQLHRR